MMPRGSRPPQSHTHVSEETHTHDSWGGGSVQRPCRQQDQFIWKQMWPLLHAALIWQSPHPLPVREQGVQQGADPSVKVSGAQEPPAAPPARPAWA